MSNRISNHGSQRIVERVKSINTKEQAKRLAKQALVSGKTIDKFVRHDAFFNYLSRRRHQSNSCSVRVFHDHIYIWRGKNKTLVTAYPVPEKFLSCLGG